MTRPQPRDVIGRFGTKPQSEPEVTVPSLHDVEPGLRVAYRGIPGHRVIGVDGDMLVLRPPQGGKVIAASGDVTPMTETPEEYQSNLVAETAIAKLLVSGKKLSRQQKEILDQPASPEAGAALEHLLHVFTDGKVSMERYVYVMQATQEAPVGLNHAAMGIMCRPHLSDAQYEALTAAARRAGAEVPA